MQSSPPKLDNAQYYYAKLDEKNNANMCIIQRYDDAKGEVVFSVWNGYPFDITLTFRPTLKNMQSDATFPLHIISPPNSTSVAYSATIIDRSLPYTWNNSWDWRMGKSDAVHDDTYIYTLPFPAKKKFKISQGYYGTGSHFDDFTHSIDWEMPIGTPILAARDGTVMFVRDQYYKHSIDPIFKNYTNTITVVHNDGTMAEYSHIKKDSARVKVGDVVKVGDEIALSADVGYAVSPHLHFRIFRIVDETKYESIPVRFKNLKPELYNY
ncbi:MAG: M23 family metallopeptidase [Candidatus Margulisiibacteriota bacterium]